MTKDPSRVPISEVKPPSGAVGHVAAPRSNETVEVPPLRPKGQGSPFSRSFSDLSGPRDCLPLELDPPVRETEAEKGHTWHLARSLAEDDVEHSEHVYEPFPDDVPRVPVANEILDTVDDLSGCAVRLSLLMINAAQCYRNGSWETSPRFLTRSDLDERCPEGLGMSPQSVRTAAQELEKRGWLEISTRGQSHAYRWVLDVPNNGYTYLPRALFHEHARLSHSALAVLLTLYRSTWGWTRRMDGQTQHQASARLSTSEIARRAGLSKPTVRSATDELTRLEAVDNSRPHAGSAFFWSVNLSFFRDPRPNFCPPSTPRKKSIQQTRTGARSGVASSSGDYCRSEREGEGRKRKDTALSEGEKRRVHQITSDPWDLPYPVAANLVSRRSAEVVQSTIGAYRHRSEDIRNPGGWLRSALENLWFGPETTEAPPSKNFGGDPDAGGGFGLSHSEMADAVDALGAHSDHFEVLHQTGREEVRFVPTKYLGNWCWSNAGDLEGAAKEWAARLVTLRKKYEED